MINAADRINQALTDEARDGLRTIISLDGFLALKGEARAARWRMLDHGAKFQLCAQAIARQTGRDWTNAEVAQGIAHWDAHYDSDLMIPAAADILVVAKEQRADAVQQHDAATIRQLDRVIVGVACGARIWWDLGDLHVTSVNNPGAEYIVSCGQCNCPAFKPCWHMKLWDILLDMLDTAAGDADMEADADELASYDPPGDNPLGDEEGDSVPSGRTPAELGQRLAAMRRVYLEAA